MVAQATRAWVPGGIIMSLRSMLIDPWVMVLLIGLVTGAHLSFSTYFQHGCTSLVAAHDWIVSTRLSSTFDRSSTTQSGLLTSVMGEDRQAMPILDTIFMPSA